MSKKKRPESRQRASRQSSPLRQARRGAPGAQQDRPQGVASGRPPTRQARRQWPEAVSRKLLVGVVAGVAVVLVGAAILVSLAGSQAGPPATNTVATREGSTKGSPDARVVVDEYSDFQCPFCARFALDTFPSIDKNYVQTGKLRWTFRHFPRIGQESIAAAQAAECAGEQGQFWPFHDKLFASQQGENKGAFSNSRLKSMARELGLSEAFNSCLDSGRWDTKVNQDLNEGLRKGIEGTPTFFVGQKKLVGAQPYSVFEAAIEEALRQQP